MVVYQYLDFSFQRVEDMRKYLKYISPPREITVPGEEYESSESSSPEVQVFVGTISVQREPTSAIAQESISGAIDSPSSSSSGTGTTLIMGGPGEEAEAPAQAEQAQ